MPANRDLVPNQFGDQTLSTEEAYAACGPAAAVAFARTQGRNPTLREAVDLAKEYGWTPAGGMNGVGNQKRLLDAMGVPAVLDPNPTGSQINSAASTGHAVTISTPVHYYVADSYDPSSGALHVGNSGTARRGGAEWMTLQQISDLDGGVNGALYVKDVNQPEGGTPVATNQQVSPHGDVINIREFDDPTAKDEGGLSIGPLTIGSSRPKFRDVTYQDNTIVTEKLDPATQTWTQVNIKQPQSAANRSVAPEKGPTASKPQPNPPAFPHPPPAAPSPAANLEQIRDPATGRVVALRDPATGQVTHIPPERVPRTPQMPNRKQIVTVAGKHFEYDPESSTFAPASGLPDEPQQTTTHVIGGRIYTVDNQGNVISSTDARTPEEITAASQGVQKNALQIQKDQQALLPQQQQILQQRAQTIEYVKALIAANKLDPIQGQAYVDAVNRATDAALRGTTPYEEQKQLQSVQSDAANQATATLREQMAAASSVGSSFVSSALGAASHAMFRPGQTTLGVDPLKEAASYIARMGGDRATQVIEALLHRAGLDSAVAGGPGPGPPPGATAPPAPAGAALAGAAMRPAPGPQVTQLQQSVDANNAMPGAGPRFQPAGL